MISGEEYLCFEQGQKYDAHHLLALAETLGKSFRGEKIGMAYSPAPLAKAAYHLLSGAILAEGAHVWCFGESFLSALHFYTSFCHFPLGVYLEEIHGKLKISLCNSQGTALPYAKTQPLLSSVSTVIQKQNTCGELSVMRSLENMYLQKIVTSVDTFLTHQKILVQSENPLVQNFFSDCLYRKKAPKGDDMSIRLDENALKVSLFHRDCGWVGYPKLLALGYYIDIQAGKNVTLALDAPYLLEKLPHAAGQKLERKFETTVADNSALSSYATWYQKDACFLAIKILDYLETNAIPFPKFLNELPDFFDQEKLFPIRKPWPNLKSRFAKHVVRAFPNLLLLRYPNGHALLEYQNIGQRVRVLTESSSYAFSKELMQSIKETLLKD